MAKADENTDLNNFLGRETESAWQRYRRWLVVAAIILALLLVARWMFFSGKPQTEYRTTAITRGDLSVSVSATGNIMPTNQVVVGSQISGLVTRVLVAANDRVTSGQPLAIIDTRRLQDAIRVGEANIAQSQASVAQQEATLAESQAQLARLDEVFRLSGGKTPSAAELSAQRASVQRARAGLRVAEAQVTAARAQLSSDRTQISFAVIRSPVSGVILSRQVEPGQTVAASFNTPTLFTVAESLTRMKLDISVDEADVGQLRSGQSGTFTVDAFPQRRFNAVVNKVNLAASNLGNVGNRVVSFIATLDVENADLLLRPGMTATVNIRVQAVKDALLVPNAALRFIPEGPAKAQDDIKFRLRTDEPATKVRSIAAGGRQTVYIVDGSGRPAPVSVRTGPTDGNLTVILSGKINTSTKVITGQKSVDAK